MSHVPAIMDDYRRERMLEPSSNDVSHKIDIILNKSYKSITPILSLFRYNYGFRTNSNIEDHLLTVVMNYRCGALIESNN